MRAPSARPLLLRLTVKVARPGRLGGRGQHDQGGQGHVARGGDGARRRPDPDPGLRSERGLRRQPLPLNRTSTSPGTARTTYTGKQPVRNADLANFVTDALDLPAGRGAEFDSPRTLNPFR